jgi:hypothetical protein
MKVEKAMIQYLEVYQALYNRAPRELRDLGDNWVLVNGARMSIDELENLTSELNREYQQFLTNKRSIVKKLLNWFSKA